MSIIEPNFNSVLMDDNGLDEGCDNNVFVTVVISYALGKGVEKEFYGFLVHEVALI
ncbi:hypothetical protein [Megasphaera hominis]|uniref:hypothetical protein n=1 Tax=Megasphaera hominis TaxID=159836 RepID=UPI001FE2DCD8|nr:hypothetical protein [Megasphaera hominis]